MKKITLLFIPTSDHTDAENYHGLQYLPVKKLSESYLYDNVFKDDAGEDVSDDDGTKNPAEIFVTRRWQQQLKHSLHRSESNW